MANIIDGKARAKEIRIALKKRVLKQQELTGLLPCLAVVLVGDNPASASYVRGKEQMCGRVSIESRVYRLPEETTQQQLLDLVDELNADKGVDGILVQLPLPKHIDTLTIMDRIDYRKDVDGFHVVNAGKLMVGEKGFVPCTPRGIIDLIKLTGTEIAGKNAVVIGRSNIVGKPVAMLLMAENATVTVCHSKTQNLGDVVKNADIVVAAIGRPGTIKGDMIKDGAVVIDVGTTAVNGVLNGDVEFEEAAKHASYITPVPGGVGPMTIAMLLENTFEAFMEYRVK